MARKNGNGKERSMEEEQMAMLFGKGRSTIAEHIIRYRRDIPELFKYNAVYATLSATLSTFLIV